MMRRLLASLAISAIVWAPVGASGCVRTGTASSHARAGATQSTHKATRAKSTRARSTRAARDARGRIRRSAETRHAFMIQTGYPHGRPGYVIDHIVPLACGGADTPSNMQWQTVAHARAKDKVERKGCSTRR